MMNDREWEILKFLIKHQGEFVTSKDIALALEVSDRTIRTYMKDLALKVGAYGGGVTSKSGMGYRLEVYDNEQFSLLIYQVNENKRTRRDASQLETASDRKYYLLKKLLFENSVLAIETIAEDLIISFSSVGSLITEIRKVLLPYGLNVKNTGKQLFFLEGKERNKRRFIVDYFFSSANESVLYSGAGSNFFDETISLTEITMIVLEECREAELHLSDFVINNLVLHIALSIERLNKGFELTNFLVSNNISASIEYGVALNILKRIEEHFNLVFPLEEADYIALHLKTKTNTVDENHSNIKNQIQAVLEKLNSDMGINLTNDLILLHGLVAHFTPLLMRLENGLHLNNPLLIQMQEKYLQELTLTKQYFKRMPVFEAFKVTEDEWAYIALHLMAAIERYQNNRKINTLVVCATGYGSAQMLKTQIETKFGNALNVVDVKSYYEITDEVLLGIDLIISSINLSHIILPVPALIVNVFLTDKDFRYIQRYIDRYHNVSKTTYLDEKPSENWDKEKVFHSYFSEDRFLVIKEPTTKQQLLPKLLTLLEEEVADDFLVNLEKQIALRENFSSVVFDQKLAFPHPATPIGIKGQIVVAVCPTGVYWNEENPDVKFIFLMSPSRVSNEGLQDISSSLIQLVQDEDIREKTLKSNSYEEFRELFIRIMKEK